MKIENQCCSVEQAKKLKQLGVIHKSVFYWHPAFERPIFGEVWVTEAGKQYKKTQVCNDKKGSSAAFTVAELGVMIPDSWEKVSGKENCRIKYLYGIWQYEGKEGSRIHRYRHIDMITDVQDNPPTFNTEAQCRASLLIYLLEKNLTTATEVNNRLSNS